jgi:hypothetical protein
VKLKARRIINQQLFRRNRLRILRFFNHDFPSFAITTLTEFPFINTAYHHF